MLYALHYRMGCRSGHDAESWEIRQCMNGVSAVRWPLLELGSHKQSVESKKATAVCSPSGTRSLWRLRRVRVTG